MLGFPAREKLLVCRSHHCPVKGCSFGLSWREIHVGLYGQAINMYVDPITVDSFGYTGILFFIIMNLILSQQQNIAYFRGIYVMVGFHCSRNFPKSLWYIWDFSISIHHAWPKQLQLQWKSTNCSMFIDLQCLLFALNTHSSFWIIPDSRKISPVEDFVDITVMINKLHGRSLWRCDRLLRIGVWLGRRMLGVFLQEGRTILTVDINNYRQSYKNPLNQTIYSLHSFRNMTWIQ